MLAPKQVKRKWRVATCNIFWTSSEKKQVRQLLVYDNVDVVAGFILEWVKLADDNVIDRYSWR